MCDNKNIYQPNHPKQAKEKYRKLTGLNKDQPITEDILDDWAIDAVAVKVNADREKVKQWLIEDEKITMPLKQEKMKKNKLNKNAAGAAGESYVLAELLRRGYIASTLYECAENYDILAYHPENNKHLKIQVKTSQQKGLCWTLGNNAPGYDNNTYYIFVTLFESDPPQYYIVHSETVHYRVERRHSSPTKSGNPRKDSRRKFIIEKEEVAKFKDNWDLLI